MWDLIHDWQTDGVQKPLPLRTSRIFEASRSQVLSVE